MLGKPSLRYAFYFTIVLLMMSVYLGECSRSGMRETSLTVTEPKSKPNVYNMIVGCNGNCLQSSQCTTKSCLYDAVRRTYSCLYLGDELPRVMGYPSVCGGYCQHDRDCWDMNYCPRCNYDPVKLTYYCGK
ncbi:hypothetical protein H5410_032806 [Solanum commersonii]|uniref:Uncharacterized protein n=1 Tax=Solanum commersonii TaxID=4109 RepID=A0A9J5YQP7_SOLCO|nr:hypothetical protein H5410_032806 [Solanum commersonii]